MATHSALHGDTFIVCDDIGDIGGGDQSVGLFSADTRMLSRLKLEVDGRAPQLLSVDTSRYWAITFYLAGGDGSIYDNSSISIVRELRVGNAVRHRITVTNHGTAEAAPKISLSVAADFADIFEVKEGTVASRHRGQTTPEWNGATLRIRHHREDFVRTIEVRFSDSPQIDHLGARWRPSIAPGDRWQTETVIDVGRTGGAAPSQSSADDPPRPNMRADLEEWLGSAPALETDWQPLRDTYHRSLVDLAALRFYSPLEPHESMPAAGLPWFMALFGRDSLITSFQALPFVSELAATTLDVLAARQADHDDAFRDAEPGKILHELRHGESVYFRERPQSPYFGSADSTPLYLILLDEYHRFTGDDELALRHQHTATRALEWIDRYGDRNGDGFVDYERRNTDNGLENQCWKDSWNSIVFPDGTLTALPRATCEIQGYIYTAKRRCARLAREVWGDARWADRLDDEAAALFDRFNERFWNPEARFYALALDGKGKRVDTITSNPGQLLFTGIVPDDRVEPVVDRLMGAELYSGWGVRTMATCHRAYNPIAYHNGTVWPHDNSLIAHGLALVGHADAANRIVADMLQAAEHFSNRLPETFAGYPREETHIPVRYPTACSPQAWAAGTPLLLLRAAAGLNPGGGEPEIFKIGDHHAQLRPGGAHYPPA